MRNQVLYSIIGAAALFLVNACQKPVVNPPELKLPTTSFTDVSAAGDVVVVDYTLTNGVEGSEIKVDGDYDWAKVTAIKSASIEVTVDPNETTEPRTAEFDVTYPGVTKDLSFSITQEAGEAPVVDAPVITLEPTSAEVPAAGESGGFNYEIANPVDDGAVSCSVLYPEGDAGGWITCDEADAEADGRINYEVSANEGDARAATIVVSYPGAEDVDFVISQAAAGGEAGYDYEYTFVTFFANYFDNETIETADNYNFSMSDGAFEPGDVQYNFDLYTELASNGVLPAGTYTFDERAENYQPGTFSKFSNFGMAGEEADPVAFKGGTITISKDESGNYSFEAELTDANDKTHHVTYTGPMDFGGGDEPSDEVSYDFEYSYLTFYEGEGQNGEDNFFLALSDMPFDADGYETDGCALANFDIYAAAGTSGVLPAGTYRFDDYNYTEGTFSVGSYIRTPEKDYIYFSDGTINVSESGDEYIFEATLTGNDGITYKVTYTGAIAEPEAPSEPVALEMKYHQVMYYEGYDSSESDEFCLSLSDMPFADDYGTGSEGSYVAWLDIYAPNGTSGVLPEGTYNYDDSYTRPPMSFVSGSTITYPGEDYGVRVSDGTIEVSESADGKYSIEARLSLVDGNDYIVTYTGPVGEESDEPEPVDVTFDISVSNIGVNDFTYSIIPSDKSVSYFHAVVPKMLLEQSNVYVNGVLDDDALLAFDEQTWYPNLDYIYEMYVHQGDLVDASGVFTGEDVVYCYAFDPDSKTKLSPVTYIEVKEEEPVVVNFNVSDIEVKGTTISFYVDPQGYEGYWYPISIETARAPEDVMAYCGSYMAEMVSYYSQYGYEYEDILSNFCYTGSSTAYAEGLYPNTEYTIVLAALTDNCQVSSIAASFNETTGVASENVIDINVTDITGSTAVVNFTPSIKTEYYAYSVFLASALEGATDSDIMYSMLYSQSTGYAIDDYSAQYGGLPASTELTVVAFGIDAYSMNPTTGLFKKNFTTTEAYSGDVEFNMEYDVYYDREASASAASASGYSDLADYLKSEDVAALGDALFILDVNTNPEDMLNVRYNIFSESQNEMSDDELIASVEKEAYNAISGYTVLPYGSYFIAGLAYNDLDERGPLFRSEVFTLSPDGVSDPQGFIEFIYGPSTKSASSSVKAVPEISTVKSSRSDADALEISSFTRQNRPLFKVPGK